MTEIERIARLLTKTFNKGAWYGPTVREVLALVSPAQANARAGKSHSIIELVLHMVSWRTFVTRRLRGDETFQVSGDQNFPAAGAVTWQEAVRQLEESQADLEDAVRNFQEEKLGDLVPNSSHKYTFYTLIHGIIQHDIYHVGQIQLILRAHA